ncbi:MULTISPECIES: ABC transporter transmembrane domain-containing protein [Furfurilactobacillus]|uniref:ABC transporter transmembrane domain-containing protein n=1 Tax=Furfurilactobacillus TaxID=2767882 RepID=UPI001EE324DC|nr:ABC transporter transmembrane domain-containing protein [Furfurilactobacillus milii]
MAQPTSRVTIGQMFKFVFGQVLHHRWLLILNIFALTIISLLEFVIPQYTQFIIDHVIPRHNIQLLTVVVVGLLGTAVILGVLNYVSTYYMGVMSQGAITNLRTELYQSILQLDTQFFESGKLQV